MPGQFNGVRRVSSGNGAERTGYPYAKECSCTPTPYYIKKNELTLNQRPKYKNENYAILKRKYRFKP